METPDLPLEDRKKPRVAVLYNLVGEDEFEVLRKELKEGKVKLPDMAKEDEFEIEEIATVREEVQAVVEALCDEGFDAVAINVEDDFDRLLDALTEPRPDAVFNLVEWFNDDSRQEDRVAALYDLLEIPYTGSPPSTLSLCQRKGLTKQILRANGIPTPRFKLVTKEPIPKLTGLRYPMIVKPAWGDASEGVTEDSVVDDREGLERKVRTILDDFEEPALIEEFIAGRELGASVLGNHPPRVLPFEEMDFSGLPEKYRGIISFESKWNPLHEVYHAAELVCPADIPKQVERRANELALRTYQILGCRDYARVDMRLDDRNRLFVLEVNPNPDLTEGVAFMASAEAAGIPFSKALKVIVDSALSRGEIGDEDEVEEEGLTAEWPGDGEAPVEPDADERESAPGDATPRGVEGASPSEGASDREEGGPTEVPGAESTPPDRPEILPRPTA